MKIITLRQSFLYRAIALVLLCLFLLNDIASANPDMLERGSRSCLQVPSAIQRPTDSMLAQSAIKLALIKHRDTLDKERYFSVPVYGQDVRPYFHPDNKDGNRQIVPVSVGSKKLLAVLNLDNLSIAKVVKRDEPGDVLVMSRKILEAEEGSVKPQEVNINIENDSQSSPPEEQAPPSPAGIKSFRKTFTPDMTYEEYSLKVAWWLEELVFFTLPMVFSYFAFGMGGREYMITMALVQSAFYFWHDGTFTSLSPKKQGIRFAVALFGGLVAGIAAPLASFGLLQNPAIVCVFIIAASIFKIFGHREANFTAFRYGWSPAALAEGAVIPYIRYDTKKIAKELLVSRQLERDTIKSYSMSVTSETLAKMNVSQLSTGEKLKVYLKIVAHITSQLSKQYGIEISRDRIMAYLETIISKSSDKDQTTKVVDQVQAEIVAKFERIARGEEIPLNIKMGNIGAVSTLDLSTNTVGIDAGVIMCVASHPDAKDPISTVEVLLASIIARQFFGHMCSSPEAIASEETATTLNTLDAKYFANFISKAKTIAPKANVYSPLYQALQDIKDPAEVPFTAFYMALPSESPVSVWKKYFLEEIGKARSDLHKGDDKAKAHKYKPLAVLGKGGMGIVLLAYDLTEGKKVAIKIALQENMGGAQALARFRSEINNTRKVQSQDVVQISDWGDYGAGEDMNYYYVMEYLPWPTVNYLIKHGGLSIVDSAIIGIKAASAVQNVHDAGLVHRDIKPENMMISPDLTRFKLMDFGLIKDIGAGRSQGLTMSGVAMGTPHYMAPEQCKDSKYADKRSDVYSLGAMLYEMVTGQKPFDGENPTQIMMKACTEKLKSPSAINSEVDNDLEYIIMRAMEKEREDRYQTAAEFGEDLSAWLNGFEVQQAQPGMPKTITKIKLDVGRHVKAAKGRQVGGYRRVQQAGKQGLVRQQVDSRKGVRDLRGERKAIFGQTQKSWWTPMRIGVVVLAAFGLFGLIALLSSAPKDKPKPPEVVKVEPVKPQPIIKPEPVKPGQTIKPEPVVKPEPIVKPDPTVKPEPKLYSLIPKIKGGTSTEVEVTASSHWKPTPPTGAIDGHSSSKFNSWSSLQRENYPCWLKLKFKSEIIVTAYKITLRNADQSEISPPKDWILQGSNDDKNWIDLDAQKDQFPEQNPNKPNTYNFSNPKPYVYYRLLITAGYNENAAIGELDLLGPKPLGGGAWWNNQVYVRYFAWLETPLVLLLAAMFPQDYSMWAFIIAGFGFWLPHFIGNRQAVYSADVLGLTAATALVAALFPAFGIYSFVTLASAGLLTLGHLIINLQRARSADLILKKPSDETKVLQLKIDTDFNLPPKKDSELVVSAAATGNTVSLSRESKILGGSDPAMIRPSPLQPASLVKSKERLRINERYGMPMLRDLRSPEQLALCIVEQLGSLSITNKLVLAFDSNVAAGYTGNPLNVIRYFEELQKSGKYPSIKDVEIVINTPEKLVTKINEYEGDKNTEVFMFAMKESRAALKDVEKRVHATFIEKNEFEPDTYYPLAEVVAITVAQYFDNIITSDGTIITLMIGDKSIDLKDLKIASLSYEQGVLIFKLLPRSKQYDNRKELCERYENLRKFLEAA